MNRYFLAPLLIVVGLALSCCTAKQATDFGTVTAANVAAINSVNNALIQLDTTVINNTTQLAAALAKIECPIIQASVALGNAVAADPKVAKNVKAVLTKAGPAGALASDVCTAVGFSPTAPASAAPASAILPVSGG